MMYHEEYQPEAFFNIFSESHAGMSSITARSGNTGLPGLAPFVGFPSYPERCKACYRLRLEKTAEQASQHGFDAFTTSLLISPYQNREDLISIGNEYARRHNVMFFLKDFRPHFRQSMAGARALGLYRQKYCGCVFSREERKRKKRGKHKIKSLHGK
jgi:predicted adenine nucleotide alpha hydrolase (AANH) superfamily ATPase